MAEPVINPPHADVCCTRLEDVSVTLGGNSILNRINLHLHCGELTVIIGPNGAGKTSLLRAILGEIPFTGKIHNELPHIKKNRGLIVGYVPQKLEFDLHSPVTVLDLFSVSIAKRPVWLGHEKRVVEKAREICASVNAAHLLRRRIGTLSGGELQRALLAIALTPTPDLLLLDEPVSGVDPAGTDLFYQMISDLRRIYHMSILLISHDLTAAARYADRMLFLNQSILCDGSPASVLTSDTVLKTFGSTIIPPQQHSSMSRLGCSGTEAGEKV